MSRRKHAQDSRQDKLIFLEQARQERGKSPSLLERIADKGGKLSTISVQTPINNTLDYQLTNTTMRPFFSQITRRNGNYTKSFEDHFNLARDTFNGVYSMETHRNGDFTCEYGVPHKILINLTHSEIISLYQACGKEKESYNSHVSPEHRFQQLLGNSFVSLVIQLINSGQRYNAISVMWRKINKEKRVPPLAERLSKISKEAREEFYRALSQHPVEVRQPYRKAPARLEHPEAFYYTGIDTYVGKLIGMFSELYRLKTIRR